MSDVPDVPGSAQLAGRGLSISVKLPLLIGVLLVVTVGGYTVAAYRSISRSAQESAESRLGGVADQLTQLLVNSRTQMATALRALADTAPLSDFLSHPTAGGRTEVEAVLRSAAQTRQVAAVELKDKEGRRLLAMGAVDRWADGVPEAQMLARLTASDSVAISPFRLVGDTVGYEVATAIGAGGGVQGYLVRWHRVASSPESREQLRRLIGSGAQLYFGSVETGVWTDLTQRIDPPSADPADVAGVQRYTQPTGRAVLAAARSVPATPWSVVVEFPVAVALAPARLFLRRMLLAGGLSLMLGLVAAWGLSRTITRPLRDLTRATERMAGGDYMQYVNASGRGDELGRLAATFNAMVDKVHASHGALEQRVEERTQALQQRNEELEAFAYSISHDLRAPLRAMEGFSDALLEDYGHRLDGTGREYASRVVAAARRMDRLIRDLLAYSRITRADLAATPLDMERLVRDAAEQAREEAGERDVHIQVEGPFPRVVGHATTVTQVLTNLLSNAVKFVPPERTPEIRVRAEQRRSVVRVWVEDNGIGIAPEHHERIFRVFERLHGVEEYSGTGIGLAIVRKGMERMGGRAGVTSKPRSGSRFWIELPEATVEPSSVDVAG